MWTVSNGCRVVTVVDSLYEFDFRVSVISENETPVSDASVFFEDMTIDSWAAKRGHSLLLGSTNPLGELSREVSYLAGYRIEENSSPSEFLVRAEHIEYMPTEIKLKISDLETRDGRILVKLVLRMEENLSDE